ncbi:transmembrane protein, putative [Medicago truncatula]|uniref:Transmembrane protein, putative n=1 Tax=Medicago truncatula TaxID=3880 RepID=G7KHT2_MEDTR|nr:transmembrane protein, putative [Medicago truncatula]
MKAKSNNKYSKCGAIKYLLFAINDDCKLGIYIGHNNELVRYLEDGREDDVPTFTQTNIILFTDWIRYCLLHLHFVGVLLLDLLLHAVPTAFIGTIIKLAEPSNENHERELLRLLLAS